MTKFTIANAAYRALIVVSLPFILVWAVISRVWHEVKSIPFYCWCDICQECDHAVKMWKDGLK